MRALVLLLLLAAPHAHAATPWQAVAGGGLAHGEGDQRFATLALTRRIGDGYARVTGAVIGQEDEEAVSLGEVAFETRTLTLAGGYRWGRLYLDAWGLAGDRAFKDVLVETEPVTTINRRRTTGDLAAAGVSLSYAAIDAEGRFVAPFVSLDWSRVGARAVERDPGGVEVFDERSDERGWTGALGVAAERAVVPGRLSVSANLAIVASSNARALATRELGLPGGVGGAPIELGEDGGDSWLELGLGGAVRLARSWRLELAGSRTVGLADGDSATVALRLRADF